MRGNPLQVRVMQRRDYILLDDNTLGQVLAIHPIEKTFAIRILENGEPTGNIRHEKLSAPRLVQTFKGKAITLE
jgi:hypothetical protein